MKQKMEIPKSVESKSTYEKKLHVYHLNGANRGWIWYSWFDHMASFHFISFHFLCCAHQNETQHFNYCMRFYSNLLSMFFAWFELLTQSECNYKRHVYLDWIASALDMGSCFLFATANWTVQKAMPFKWVFDARARHPMKTTTTTTTDKNDKDERLVAFFI